MRERRRVLEVVRDDDRREPEVVEQLAKLGTNPRARMGVERREWLVEEEQRRVARERASERDSLALSSRQLVDTRSRELSDAEALEQGSTSSPRRAPNRTL